MHQVSDAVHIHILSALRVAELIMVRLESFMTEQLGFDTK